MGGNLERFGPYWAQHRMSRLRSDDLKVIFPGLLDLILQEAAPPGHTPKR